MLTNANLFHKRMRRRHSNHTWKRGFGQTDAWQVGRFGKAAAHPPVHQMWFGKNVAQETEAGQLRGPAALASNNIKQLDFEQVGWLTAIYPDLTRKRLTC